MFFRRHRFIPLTLVNFCIGLALAAIVSSSYAGIYKCSDKYGRTSIGDQPCMGNTPPVVSYAAPAKTSTTNGITTTPAQKASPSELAQAPTSQAPSALVALEQRIQLKHNAECRDLRLQLKAHGHFGESLLEPKQPLAESDKLPWESYRIKCLSQAKDVVVLEEAQQEGARQEKLRKSNCEAKAREYETRKQRASTSTESELAALAALQSEVARGCR